MRAISSVAILVLAFAMASCSSAPKRKQRKPTDALPANVITFIRDAERVELYSIHPHLFPYDVDPKIGDFRGDTYINERGVYGSMQLSKEQVHDVVALLDPRGRRGGSEAMCHLPRHAILAEKGDAHCIVAICFQCHNADWFLSDSGKSERVILYDGWRLKAALNGLLRDSGVTLAEDVDDKPANELGE